MTWCAARAEFRVRICHRNAATTDRLTPSAPLLRRAMTAALSVEPARTPDAYRRFYTRVLRELNLASEEAA